MHDEFTICRYCGNENCRLPHSLDEIRARCDASVFEMVSGTHEYFRSQQIIRDRAVLRDELDRLTAQLREARKALQWARDGFVVHAPSCVAYIERIDAALAATEPKP